MYEEFKEQNCARHVCTHCGCAAEDGVLTPEDEAICRQCLDGLSLDELLVLCDASSVTQLLLEQGFCEI